MDPYVDYYSKYFTNFDIHITLFLHFVFSYFSIYNPSIASLKVTYEIYLINPEGRWNLVSDAYVKSK